MPTRNNTNVITVSPSFREKWNNWIADLQEKIKYSPIGIYADQPKPFVPQDVPESQLTVQPQPFPNNKRARFGALPAQPYFQSLMGQPLHMYENGGDFKNLI